MCGMKIVAIGTDSKGNINIEELRKAAEANKENLSCLMVRIAIVTFLEMYYLFHVVVPSKKLIIQVTYPSTHGVYEEGIDEICKIVHDNGGQVYMDGANMNAQVCLESFGAFLSLYWLSLYLHSYL